ncbi:Por secretion system C-terminal sorting domain-containing protein [Catalinimonas alkaloidigena]|uniref:Por secretion system C-terminal sorting domain-containing protein n=1 Tax=Catalinimonas alkaloidigena TaxID=1075417 RepID=A0A1G9RMX3_9BACT|nr:esterase-like activity of phytase family protein [Catalinimonas alkaloidigena]SDM24626.1 Por secretion system C-terminal sorting domain-containing protein [Catalinimonas alkaloidigena]
MPSFSLVPPRARSQSARWLTQTLLWGGTAAVLLSTAAHAQDDQLLKRAVLDAATFSPGPTSGTRIGEGSVNGQPVPFVDQQPVQGISAILANDNGTFWVMSDNGFGSFENSADYLLRVYLIKPRFEKKGGGKGDIKVLKYITLHDPDQHIPFAITNAFSDERLLTGADFDIESIQRDRDGTLWFGDEFGPFLLHTDAQGKVLEAPIALPDFANEGQDVRAPQNPYLEEASAGRIMNAMYAHAKRFGNERVPVMSPWYVMIDDQDPTTFDPSRETPPAGLPAASSDIFNVSSLQSAGYPVVAWTVNDSASMQKLMQQGVNGIISDNPALLWEMVSQYDGNGDGQPDFLDEEGLLDVHLFDAQGHRGGRNLRPENTLPAMEAALDYLMTTLETDCGITADGVPILDHDPHIESAKARKADGTPYTYEDEVLVKDLTLAEIQTTFIADQLLAGRPDQTNDLTLSPVSVAFASAKGLMSPYVMPSLAQLFEFVDYYVYYYHYGPGSSSPNAALRWKNAARVRFNIETKTNPRTDTDNRGDVFAERTIATEPFAKAVADVIMAHGLEERADIQSFDFNTLLVVHAYAPAIRTVCLFGDFPKVGDSGDGTNLQDQDGTNTPWLGGLYWPYRQTKRDHPVRAQGSGGFEGMAYDPWAKRLLPLLEKPLIGDDPRQLLIHEFDLPSKSYTGVQYRYPLHPRGAAIGDFILFNPKRGLIIERDGSQGNLEGFKQVYEIELFDDGALVGKKDAVDLLDLRDPHQISGPGLPGDVGLGERFAFPFVTIESVVVFNDKRIGILNDNNYPFSIGRHVGAGLPDDNEFIVLKLGEKLGKGHITAEPVFMLVDADTDADLMELKDGATLNLSTLPPHLTVRVEFPGLSFGSVVFSLNATPVQTENQAPYALAGDNNGDFAPFAFPYGTQVLTALPYSQPNGLGVAELPATVHFSVVPSQVSGFTLIDAATDQPLRTLHDGDVLDKADFTTQVFNVRVDTKADSVGSVGIRIYRDGTLVASRTENQCPYAVWSDAAGDYHPWSAEPGTYTLWAAPYAAADRQGTPGEAMQISYTVVDTLPTASTPRAQSAAHTAAPVDFQLLPNPTSGRVQVDYTSASASAVLEFLLYDATGRLLSRHAAVGALHQQLDLHDRPAGVYYAVLIHPAGRITRKVVLQ